MVKAVVFDMDGVLIDARDWHYASLNEALSYFGSEIDYEDHLDEFDGLPTKVKLKKLSSQGRLPSHLHGIVEEIKQERTLRQAAQLCFPNLEHLLLLSSIKSKGLLLGLATNSIRQTTLAMLEFAGVKEYFDSILTNEDVHRPKPDAEIYLKSAARLGLNPSEILVIEDNLNGVAAAESAGCVVLRVRNPQDVNICLLESNGFL